MLLPITKPVRSAVPTFEPVTLSEARHQCGVAEGDSYQTAFLERLITTAREQVEHDTGLVVATGTFTWKFTEWPCGDYFELPSSVRPVSSITSIVYINTAGSSATWSVSEYTLDATTVEPIVKLNYGYSWPSIRGDINGITVTLVAGYATQLAIPQRVKQAVLFLVNHWFVSRDTVSIGTISPGIEMTYDALVNGLRRSSYP